MLGFRVCVNYLLLLQDLLRWRHRSDLKRTRTVHRGVIPKPAITGPDAAQTCGTAAVVSMCLLSASKHVRGNLALSLLTGSALAAILCIHTLVRWWKFRHRFEVEMQQEALDAYLAFDGRTTIFDSDWKVG